MSTAPAMVYGALAGFAAALGAEWSLFWPTIGIALDSWAGVILTSDRFDAAPTLGVSFSGVSTEFAAGTDVSVTVEGQVPAFTGSIIGTGVSERSLSQAVSKSSEDRKQAFSINGVRIRFLCGLAARRAGSGTDARAPLYEQDSLPADQLPCVIRHRRDPGWRSLSRAFRKLLANGALSH